MNLYKLDQLANHILEEVHKAFENSLNTLHVIVIMLSLISLQVHIVKDSKFASLKIPSLRLVVFWFIETGNC